MRGEARYAWAHGIAWRTTDCVDGVVLRCASRRISATFRRARLPADGPCTCPWPAACFDQNGAASEPEVLNSPSLRAERERERAGEAAAVAPLADALATPAVEARHVHALYDTIAARFSHTRHSGWPRVHAFVRALPAGALLLDVGCGNGKYLGANPAVAALGCDRSAALVDICVRQRGFEALVADGVRLPYRSACADAVLCIAVLHHLSTARRRAALARELLRVLAPGGAALVYAWAMEQGEGSRRSFAEQDVLVPWCLQRAFVAGSDAEVAAAGGVVDAVRVVVFKRFCHVFRRGELEALLADAAAAEGYTLAGGNVAGSGVGGVLAACGAVTSPGAAVAAEGGGDAGQLRAGGGLPGSGSERAAVVEIVDRWWSATTGACCCGAAARARLDRAGSRRQCGPDHVPGPRRGCGRQLATARAAAEAGPAIGRALQARARAPVRAGHAMASWPCCGAAAARPACWRAEQQEQGARPQAGGSRGGWCAAGDRDTHALVAQRGVEQLAG